MNKCISCNGYGKIPPGTGTIFTCPHCNGTGKEPVKGETMMCPDCGMVIGHTADCSTSMFGKSVPPEPLIPQVGTRWTHVTKGGSVIVDSIANLDPAYHEHFMPAFTPSVVYHIVGNRNVAVCSLADWQRVFVKSAPDKLRCQDCVLINGMCVCTMNCGPSR